MSVFDRSRVVVSAGVAAALLAGCGAESPVSAPTILPARSAPAAHSWMVPDAVRQNLLYIADPGTGGVLVYSYPPAGLKFVGMLTAPISPAGLCVDKAQNVWVTNEGLEQSYVIYEYAHGGTSPTAILSNPNGPTIACAVDAKSGNLAVISTNEYADGPTISIYRKAQGKPKIYTDPDFDALNYCAYDDNGDLFVVGNVLPGYVLHVAELHPDGSFQDITLDQNFEGGGAVQWVGKTLDIGDSRAARIYEFAMSGANGTETGNTPLPGLAKLAGFFIHGSTVIAPTGQLVLKPGYVALYRYPGGGERLHTLRNFSDPTAAVVSLGPKP